MESLATSLGRTIGPLHLTEKLTSTDPLAIPLAIQAVISWSRYNNGGVVRTAVDFTEEPSATRALQRNALLLVGTLLASTIESTSGEDVTSAATTAARRAISESGTIPTRGSGVTIGAERSVLAVDHFSGLQYPTGLYRRTRDARTGHLDHALDTSAHELYARASVDESRPSDWPLGWRALAMSRVSLAHDERFEFEAAELGRALFELMQNTHDHARVDDAGYTLRRSVRGVHVRSFTQLRSDLVRSAEGHADLARYFSTLPSGLDATSHNDGDRLRLVAVTVFDSGPGIAARGLRQMGFKHDASFEQEQRATFSALRKSDEAAQPGMRGMGLTRVQRYLTAVGGYAMVRCGRLQLTRDFLNRKFAEPDRQADWYAGFRTAAKHVRTHGTAFTMIVPTYGGGHE